MCIRDRGLDDLVPIHRIDRDTAGLVLFSVQPQTRDAYQACLLYTSDAADERSSVDLGGRRIIKKKHTK